MSEWWAWLISWSLPDSLRFTVQSMQCWEELSSIRCWQKCVYEIWRDCDLIQGYPGFNDGESIGWMLKMWLFVLWAFFANDLSQFREIFARAIHSRWRDAVSISLRWRANFNKATLQNWKEISLANLIESETVTTTEVYLNLGSCF